MRFVREHGARLHFSTSSLICDVTPVKWGPVVVDDEPGGQGHTRVEPEARQRLLRPGMTAGTTLSSRRRRDDRRLKWETEHVSSRESAPGSPQPTDGFVMVNGLRFHYLEWGAPDLPPLVMLHGFASSARGTWTLTAPAFARRQHIVAIDERGHGESDWDPDARYTLTQYVSDVERIIEHLGLQPFLMVGHSMGGSIALAYAARNPAKVRRLVLVDSGARMPAAVAAARAQPHLAANRPLSFTTRAEAERHVRSELPEAARNRPLDYGIMERPDGSFTWRSDIAGLLRARAIPDPIRDGGLWPQVESLRSPTLVLRGGRSKVIDPETAKRMEAANPRLKVTEYPEAHHWLHQDEPDRFYEDVAAFFREA